MIDLASVFRLTVNDKRLKRQPSFACIFKVKFPTRGYDEHNLNERNKGTWKIRIFTVYDLLYNFCFK